MAVETKTPEGGTTTASPGGTTTSTAAKKKESPGQWMKKHKVATAGVGIGATVLLLSSKGRKSAGGTPSNAANEELAMERAALASQAGAASAPGEPVASGSGGGEGGGVTPANPSGADSPTTTAAAPAAGGEAGADPQLAAAIGELGGNVAALAAAESDGKAQKPATKKRPASKKASKNKAKHKKTTQHGGVTVHGRHFPGATGHHKGATHKDAHGTHQTITVHYPGKTHTSTSHNKGAHWTDHTPGHTPPRRSTPAHTAPHRVGTTGGTRAPRPRPPARRPAAKKRHGR
jgi:hypothetical protein